MENLNLRAARSKAGMSQTQLAKLCGTTTMQIWRLETGKRQLTEAWLAKLSTALNVPAKSLLNGQLAGNVKQFKRDPVKDSDLTDLERAVVRFWRRLPPEGQDIALQQLTNWARRRVQKASASQ